MVADIVLATQLLHFSGFIDDDVGRHGSLILGFPVFGDARIVQQEASHSAVSIALGIGNNQTRQKVANLCREWGAELITVIHPTASVAPSARIGPGTSVMANAVINPEAIIGSGVIVNTGATIDHDAHIGDFGHVSPNASMGGASRLGSLSQLGMGAVIIECVSVGTRTIVGAGAVVTRNIPDDVVAFGTPARVRRAT